MNLIGSGSRSQGGILIVYFVLNGDSLLTYHCLLTTLPQLLQVTTQPLLTFLQNFNHACTAEVKIRAVHEVSKPVTKLMPRVPEYFTFLGTFQSSSLDSSYNTSTRHYDTLDYAL